MHRRYLLDSLDGFKGLVFRLLPAHVVGSLASVPMTTDGPWKDVEKRAFETALGIPRQRTYWAPGGFDNVPAASDARARAQWMHAVATIKEPYIFLDPDTGFYDRYTGESAKMVLVGELFTMLATREAVIVYRHQYWPRISAAPVKRVPTCGMVSGCSGKRISTRSLISRRRQVSSLSRGAAQGWNRWKRASDTRWPGYHQPSLIDV